MTMLNIQQDILEDFVELQHRYVRQHTLETRAARLHAWRKAWEQAYSLRPDVRRKRRSYDLRYRLRKAAKREHERRKVEREKRELAELKAKRPTFVVVPCRIEYITCVHCGGRAELREGCTRPSNHRCFEFRRSA